MLKKNREKKVPKLIKKVWSKVGRPAILDDCDKRRLERAVKKLRSTNPNFSVMDIVQVSGIDTNRASYRTFVRNVKKLGYAFYKSRKKGVMTEKDFQKRRMFARSNSKKGIEYWTRDIAFYLDGVSFVYKGNPLRDVVKPKSRIWRKRQEGLQITTKGSKDLADGRRLHLIVAMAYGRGVICTEPYERMSGEYFARFIRRNFPILFEITGKNEVEPKLFVMDNDPSQTSAKAKCALSHAKCKMVQIPARSPDLNPIENVFHIVRRQLEAEVKQNTITTETWDEFVCRIKRNLWSIPKDYIDKTIASMPNRINLIVKAKGRRIKY